MQFRTRSWHPLLLCVIAIACVSQLAQAGTFEVGSRRETGQMKLKVRASQFLQRATFGPTIEDIEELATRMRQIGVRRACSEWIDQQMELEPGYHQPLTIQMYRDDGYLGNEENVWIQRYRYHSWWDRAIRGEDQLRQRVAWALIQILVTSEDGAGFGDPAFGRLSNDTSDPDSLRPRWLGPTNYYDLMVQHAFGNYEELLSDVTYHPVMGTYLSHLRNRKTDLAANRFPDENYAREIMQLFTIGLYELHPDGRLKTDENGELIPTYDNEVIKEFAKVFTGLTQKPDITDPNIVSVVNQFLYRGNDFQYPMVMFNSEHEPGVKQLLNGTTAGSTQTVDGEADIASAIANLMEHPNIAPFISRRLIQRLVKSNPSRAYIRRVARKFANNGRGERGDLAAVVKAILLDPEAWRGTSVRSRTSPHRVEVVGRGTEYSSLAEPVIRYARFLRAGHPTSTYRTGRVMGLPRDGHWTQGVYRQPTVFSFFLPDYQPPGDLVGYTPSRRIPNGFLTAPEFQQKTAVTSNYLQTRYMWDTDGSGTTYNAGSYLRSRLDFDWSKELEMAKSSEGLADLIDQLDLVMCCGTVPQDYKDRMHEVITNNTSGDYALWRVQTAVRAIVCSPFCAIVE